jgi:hypothetical protein
VLAASLCACTGPDEISLGGHLTPSTERYLSPTGSDANDGSQDRPWKTFAHALPLLAPGSTLRLLASDAPYDDSTSGTLNVHCEDVASPTSPAPSAVRAQNGKTGMVITVRADGEHTALVLGNGHVPAISIDSCHDWAIEGLRVESQDAPDTLTARDTGSVVVLEGANDNVTLRRLLARHPNGAKPRSNVMRIGDGASNVSIEECELYDFHENAIEARRSGPLFLMRNYVNSRSTSNAGATMRGNYGVVLEETHDTFVENNVVENVASGFAVVGRAADAQVTSTPSPPGNNHLLGNVVFGPTDAPALMGFRLDSQCAGANPCDAAHTVFRTEIGNDAVIGSVMGISDAGSVETHIHDVSIIRAARGISLSEEPQNQAVPTSSLTTTNTLVADFQSTAFAVAIASEMTWGFDHCAAAGGYTVTADYAPDDPARVTSKVNATPELGQCLVYLPSTSPLKGAGASAGDVGANVIYEYDVRGQLTAMPLWDATSGTFLACGALVKGVNDDRAPKTAATQSCITVHHRLHVGGADGCPLPQ